MKLSLPPVERTLAGKTLLVIGATGFLGKVFLEKLLRTCPELKSVYLLVRAPHHQAAESRLENEILASPLFVGLNFSRVGLFAIPGDTTEPRLGMNLEDYISLLGEVDLVVNTAASTDFRDPLLNAIRANTVSVRNIAEFIEASKTARLLHISTCYVNEAGAGPAGEEACAQPAHAKHRLPENSEEIFELLNAELKHADGVKAGGKFAKRHGWNNVYTFGKWLGEKVLLETIPCTILRPSIIESCLFDPIPGWIEGFKVADPLFYAGGRDIVKMFPGDNSAIMDVIPADMVANAMMLCLNEIACSVSATRIYQASSSVANPISMMDITKIIRGGFGKDHLRRSFMVPAWLFFPVTHFLRALQLTFGRQKSRAKTERLLSLAKLYQPYTSSHRTFESRKLRALHGRSAPADRLRFLVDSARINWTDYLAKIHIPGLQKFVLAQRMKT